MTTKDVFDPRRPLHVISAALLAFLASGIQAQSTPLPPELESEFGTYGPFAVSMTLPTANPDQVIQGRFTFENQATEKGVEVIWRVSIDGHGVAEETVFYDTSYKPTALCARVGEGITLYVAGWDERAATALFEEWVFTDYAIIQALPVGGGSEPTYSLSGPRVVRNGLLSCPSILPVSSIGCDFRANRLWVLEIPGTAPRRVLTFPIDASLECTDVAQLTILSTPVDENAYPLLLDANTIVTQQHPVLGFVIYLEQRRPWESGFDYKEPYHLIVFVDADKDGTVDSVQTPSYTDFYTQWPLTTWTWDYQ